MNGKWKCIKCNTFNDNRVTRCSWCATPKPVELTEDVEKRYAEDKLRLSLHGAIDKMNPQNRLKVWRWIEDNII